MNTKLQFLSHASCIVETNKVKILMDPWLVGSCYWRSWWNYPPVKEGLIDNLNIDAIYITHVHWDHWHGPSLKKLFSKDTLIITHDEPNKRSVNDLKSLGFNNIKLLKHGESMTIGDIKITPYQFGLFLNDSALVIETPDTKIFNANDCKIAGSSLRYILNKHGRFDFALRSHSSANDRICYSIKGSDFIMDDSNHYSKAFALFMNVVKPKYAIPFASNHCHLHKDVYEMNNYINDPFKLKEFIDNNIKLKETELKIMISGDYWSSKEGFNIDVNGKNYYLNKDINILKYKNSVSSILDKFYGLENRLKPNSRIIKMFESQIQSIPIFFRKKIKNYSYKLVLFNEKKEFFYEVNPYLGKVESCLAELDNGSEVRIPIKIFIDSVSMNMFHHSSISKRNKYIFINQDLLKTYEYFQDLLEYVELEVFPLKIKYLINILISYSRRWRELLVYFRAFLLKRKGMPIYDVEKEILNNT
jgi:UDP-MurNAc hydroxylase